MTTPTTLSEADKAKALEAFSKEFGIPMGGVLAMLNVGETGVWRWLRACEWMHEYATQAAYERAAQLCQDSMKGTPSALVGVAYAELIRGIAKGK